MSYGPNKYGLVSSQEGSGKDKVQLFTAISLQVGLAGHSLMLKGQRIRALILLGTMLGPPILSTRALPRPNRQPKVWMGIAGTATMPDGALVALRGFLVEADFFEKLEPKKTADGIIFQRGGKIVEFFPGEMQCKLLVTGLPRFDDKIHRRIDPNLNAVPFASLVSGKTASK